MRDPSPILCDGCGQPASPEHLARRLQLLEWATRYRPIHLYTLLLGAASPQRPSDFLYSPEEQHSGEAAQVLAAAGISQSGKAVEALHTEFQRRGLYLTHVLECPLEAAATSHGRNEQNSANVNSLLTARLPTLFTRIRRSLKPKRLVLISESLAPLVAQFSAAQLGCELVLDDGRPYVLDGSDSGQLVAASQRLQDVLSAPATR
jgi:hypothetical protein